MEPFHKIDTDDLNLDNVSIDSIDRNFYGFFVKRLNIDSLLEHNKFLKWLYNLYPFDPGILRLRSNKHHKWHVDYQDHRGVTINALVSDSPSFTLFSPNIFEEGDLADIIKLEYELNKMYLFNPQMPHTVINFEKPREIFSLYFKQNKKELTYDKLKGIIQEQYYNKEDV
tara:strand:+ start:257 stop:766 length:510 start_codon:yes stop_codon:yes gene_type:complete